MSKEAMSEARRHRARGFTLIELVISITLLSMIMGLMYESLVTTLDKRRIVQEALRGPKVANAILAQIFKDFRYIYWGGLNANTGFRGKASTLGGKPADRVAFVTARRTRTVGSADDGQRTRDDRESPLTEVGYALRYNEEHSQWLELWRREDFFVDSQPTEGGYYTMIYDKIRSFRLRYFPVPEEAVAREGLEEWDSSVKRGIPYAILLRIEFDVSDPVEDQEYKQDEIDPIHRIILLRGGYNVEYESGGADAAPGDTPPPGR